MNAVTYFEKQLANINALLHGVAGDLTDEEWVTRLAPRPCIGHVHRRLGEIEVGKTIRRSADV